jgi:RNA polymerase sigma factor (sigma-70 family)
MGGHEGEPRGCDRFKATHWRVVLAAGHPGSPQSAHALNRLCRTYWYPLYAYVRRKGHSEPEAKDLTQEFFAQLLQNHLLARANPLKGKFRSYLLAAMDHFLANERRRAQTLKRGGGEIIRSLDDTAQMRYATEPITNLSPERAYERQWALSLFEQALHRLKEQYGASGRVKLYQCLKEFLSADPERGDYERVGLQLGMSQSAVAAAVYRLRQGYRELVREEVAQTVASPAEIEDELRGLLAALGNP